MKLLAYIRSTLGRARRGQSLVEFALVAPLFFLLVFGIIDFGRLFFTKLTLQHALREAGRYAVTGQHLTGTDPDTGDPYKRVKSIRKIAQKNAAGLLANPSNIEIESGGTTGFAGRSRPDRRCFPDNSTEADHAFYRKILSRWRLYL